METSQNTVQTKGRKIRSLAPIRAKPSESIHFSLKTPKKKKNPKKRKRKVKRGKTGEEEEGQGSSNSSLKKGVEKEGGIASLFLGFRFRALRSLSGESFEWRSSERERSFFLWGQGSGMGQDSGCEDSILLTELRVQVLFNVSGQSEHTGAPESTSRWRWNGRFRFSLRKNCSRPHCGTFKSFVIYISILWYSVLFPLDRIASGFGRGSSKKILIGYLNYL